MPTDAPTARRRTLGTVDHRRLDVAAGVAVGSLLAGVLIGRIVGTVPTVTGLSKVQAVVLGVVEGTTEFLPVSSTGHLAITGRLLGLDTSGGALASYEIAIQAGAILAVVALFRRRIASLLRGAIGRDPAGLRLAGLLLVAFAPAAIVGALGGSLVKDHLLGPWPTVAAWLVGGVLLVAWRPSPANAGGGVALSELSVRHAAVIGGVQVMALWPGVSRSLVTLLAGLAVGLALDAAIEFAFLLGLATLGAATAYETLKDGQLMIGSFGLLSPTIGLIAAFITALVSAGWMVRYLRTRPLADFGWYRIAIAGAAAGLVLAGAIR